ncbi:MAG: serine hydrolase [Terracoccus sp.]
MSPAGKQLDWFLKATATSSTIDPNVIQAHFATSFLEQAPPEKLNGILQALVPKGGLRATSVEPVSPTQIEALVITTQGPLRLLLATGPDGLINGLVFRPPAAPAAAPSSWNELDQRLRKVAPQASMLTATISSNGQCQPVHAVDSASARPLGSVFKLYVLEAVADEVAAGALSWDDPLTITADLKSLPSGELQNRPDNSTVTVREAALKMISISDNTAADLLAHRVGRAKVEAAQAALGSLHAEANTPFLRTRELFVLKGSRYPTLRDAYLKQSAAERATYLDSTIAQVPLSKVAAWTTPRDITTLEWFASPDDICRAYAGLERRASTPALKPIATVLSASDGGLGLDAASWPSVWFKGGSEPGVLTLAWRALAKDGTSYVTVMMTQNPEAPIDETTAAPELLALAKGAFTMARGS